MDQQTKLIPIDIKSTNEHWNSVELVDGSVLKTKWVYTNIFAVYNMNNEHLKNPDGTLMYQIHCAPIHVTTTPLANVQTSNARN